MIRYFLVLFCGILLMSCAPKRAKNLPPAVFVPTLDFMRINIEEGLNLPDTVIAPPISVLSMERKPCLIGKCPAYKIEFYDNGLVLYEGKSYVDRQGKYQAEVTPETLETLLLMAKNIGYLEYENVYPTSGKIIYEVPLTITFVRYYGEINYVENHHNAPVPLIRFEEHIEQLIENLEWKQIK